MGRGGGSGWGVIVGGRGRKKRKGGGGEEERGRVCLLTTTAADLTAFVHFGNNTQCVCSILQTRSSERRSRVLSRLRVTDRLGRRKVICVCLERDVLSVSYQGRNDDDDV